MIDTGPGLFGDADPPGPEGFKVFRKRLDLDGQRELLRLVMEQIVADAPFQRPTMPRSGVPFRLELTNAGERGWWSDAAGFRYVTENPKTGKRWPEIPITIRLMAHTLAADAGFGGFLADGCLVNRYRGEGASLGVHRDNDEATFDHPVVSISLGDTCAFRFGLEKPPKDEWLLRSGDAVVFGGRARLGWHTVHKVFPGTSDLVPGGGRINLTLRRAGR